MRNTTSLMLAAVLTAAAPAAAQTADPAANTGVTATDPAVTGTATDPALTGTDPAMTGTDPALTGAAPVNGLAGSPAPATSQPIDTAFGEPTRIEDDDGFPWGVLGLLGLAGLIPRKRRDDDRPRTDTNR